MSKKNANWSSKDWDSGADWQRSAVEHAGQSSQNKWKSSKPRVKCKEISNNVEELGMLVDEKHLDHKLQGKLKKNRSIRKF